MRGVVAALGGLILTVAACASGNLNPGTPREPADSGDTTTTVPVSAPQAPVQPQVRVTVAGGCPGSLGNARDVRNSIAAPADALVPQPATVQRGLVCQYGQSQAGPGSYPALRRSTALDTPHARRLAHALAQVVRTTPTGTYSCPMELAGTDTIITLQYGAGADVDLWYASTGCQSIDNGHVHVYQAGNPSFYETFQTTYDAVVPAAAR